MPMNAVYRGPADLPETLSVFPPAGALLLPCGQMPLNIFELRYLAMVDEGHAPVSGGSGNTSVQRDLLPARRMIAAMPINVVETQPRKTLRSCSYPSSSSCTQATTSAHATDRTIGPRNRPLIP